MTLEEFTTKIGGTVKTYNIGQEGIWFDGPPEAPKNALFIPLDDLGYSPTDGIFRKSLKPHGQNILKI